MILIGQYDSPFVRRVGIAMRLYDLPFEHRPWSTFGDADKIRPYNPLLRVPALVLDDGTTLVDSHVIIDYLDQRAPAGRAMFPAAGPERHQALRVAAFATGVADKAVSLFYERRLHHEVSDTWVDRCSAQIRATLAMLEAERAARTSAFWFGAQLGHADVAVAAALRFLAEAHPGLIAASRHPALTTLAIRLEAMPVFEDISQPFIAPA